MAHDSRLAQITDLQQQVETGVLFILLNGINPTSYNIILTLHNKLQKFVHT